MGRPKEYVNMRVRISELGTLAKASPAFAKLAEKHLPKKVEKLLPSLSRDCIKAIREGLASRGEAYVRVLRKQPDVARLVSPRFYQVKLTYPMNDPEVVRRAQRTLHTKRVLAA